MKKVRQSKTIWFYTLSLIATVGTALLADENFKNLLGDNIGYVTSAMAFVGIALRLVTDKGIEIKRKHQEILEDEHENNAV